MKIILTIVISLSSFFGICQKLDFYINQTIKCLNIKSIDCYESQISYDILLEIIDLKLDSDTTRLNQEKYMFIKENIESYKEVFKGSFNQLISEINKDCQKTDWKITYLSHEIKRVEDDGIVNHYSIYINLKINDQTRKILMYLTQYKDNFYIIEPLEGTLYKSM